LKKFFRFSCGTINGTDSLSVSGYGAVFEPLWLSVFLIEPNIEILAQTVSAFLQNKKAVT